MLLAFAFVFASCSNGSDSDDDDSSTNGKPSSDSSSNGLPSSVGKNVLAGNSYQYSKADDDKTKTITYAFKDDTVTETKVEQKTGKSAETNIKVYNYTYNANTGLLYMKIVSWTSDGVKMTSMDDIYSSFKEEGISEEDAKEAIGDDDMFAEITSKCYFVEDNGNIFLGNYFADVKDVKYSKFVWVENRKEIKADFDDGEIEVDADNTWNNIKLNATEKTFSGEEIAGSYTVKTATKTLKDLNGDYKLNEENGYITINFANLPATLKSEPYNMKTGTEYKFIFDPDCDEYKKL